MYRACLHSQWAVTAAMPGAATDEELDLQSCEWSASGEHFGGWRYPCLWARVKKSIFDRFYMALWSAQFFGDRF